MEYIEERAISRATHPPRWWYRKVDDSHACLKKDYVQEFHDYLNSVNLTYISSRRLSKATGSLVYIQREELRYWLVPGNVKNNRIN